MFYHMIEKLGKRIWEDKIYLGCLLGLILLFQIKLPFYVNAPGGVIDTTNRIEYADKVSYQGSLNMLYVTEYVASIPFYLLSYVIPDWDLEKIEDSQISTNESVEEINTRNKVMLNNSIHNAIYVAYQASGKEVEIENMRYVVVGVTKENGLIVGDEVLSIDGEKIDGLEKIKSVIEKKEIGDQVFLKVKRGEKEKKVTLTIQEEEGKKVLGVVILTNCDLKMNPEISLKFRASEGGSSGGLMMALSIYSAISGKDILKGRNIAGTGTIDMEGNVGEIGGIKYKIIGAVKNKMDVILVPVANYEEAMKVKKEKKYSVEIKAVRTFEEAVDYLLAS